MSFQCLTLESSLYYAATYLKLGFLDPSVKHWDDTLLMGQNHNVRTVMDSFAVSQSIDPAAG
ncbi:hypothetical protein [Wolbachia endosymbiont (group A) of Agelastica alni]|uniref:hypothetical protein n=1 Tax=unclassified Wolbachia TaxID=2640676 RepID=UPI0039785E9C